MALDKITLDKIKTMHPKVRHEVLEMYTHANEILLGKGVRLRFSHTLRTNEEQDKLYAQGRTVKGLKVTDSKGGQSIHNYGLALDIVLLYDNNGDGVFEEASWDTLRDGDKDGVSDWLEVTRYFESKGWKNGFIKNGKKWDFPHFQKDYGFSWQKLKAMKKDNFGYVIF